MTSSMPFNTEPPTTPNTCDATLCNNANVSMDGWMWYHNFEIDRFPTRNADSNCPTLTENSFNKSRIAAHKAWFTVPNSYFPCTAAKFCTAAWCSHSGNICLRNWSADPSAPSGASTSKRNSGSRAAPATAPRPAACGAATTTFRKYTPSTPKRQNNASSSKANSCSRRGHAPRSPPGSARRPGGAAFSSAGPGPSSRPKGTPALTKRNLESGCLPSRPRQHMRQPDKRDGDTKPAAAPSAPPPAESNDLPTPRQSLYFPRMRSGVLDCTRPVAPESSALTNVQRLKSAPSRRSTVGSTVLPSAVGPSDK
mmetsp:Transcript_62385/g.190747  ORF Transcript_62385/g.190747 Transcript_62385/m.190747 type:complete len:310 (-) Transcript_62385:11-940(-)